MKKTLWIVGILSIAVVVFGVAGFAYAQDQTPEPPYGPGMMGNYNNYGPGMSGRGHGMMGGYGQGMGMNGFGMMGLDGDTGPMHESMIASLAKALDLTPEELEARHDARETLWEIAETEGFSTDEIQALMSSAHDVALENAIANGSLTPEQAEWMKDHMDQMWNGEFQEGGFGGHCGGRGRYNNTPRLQGEDL